MSMTTLQPPMIYGNDKPRVRFKDKRSSHAAADRSQKTIEDTRTRVLLLIEKYGALTGKGLNRIYTAEGRRHRWVEIDWDSPRKRAGELADDRLLKVTEGDPAGNGHPVSVYRLTRKGLREVLRSGVRL